MDKNDSSAEQIGNVLEKSLKRLNVSGRLDEYGIWPIWNETVGTIIARNAQPEKIRNGTLFVKVSGPIWMQQLQFMKEMLAEKINERLNGPVVKNIFFVVGRIETAGMELPAQTSAPDRAAAGPSLDGGFLQSIADPELRERFAKLLAAHSRRNPKK